MNWIEENAEGVLLRLKVSPNAKKSRWEKEILDGYRKIRIATPPVDGAANKSLIAFLSKCFKIKQRHVEIVSGEKSRQKIILLRGVSITEVEPLID